MWNKLKLKYAKVRNNIKHEPILKMRNHMTKITDKHTWSTLKLRYAKIPFLCQDNSRLGYFPYHAKIMQKQARSQLMQGSCKDTILMSLGHPIASQPFMQNNHTKYARKEPKPSKWSPRHLFIKDPTSPCKNKLMQAKPNQTKNRAMQRTTKKKTTNHASKLLAKHSKHAKTKINSISLT